MRAHIRLLFRVLGSLIVLLLLVGLIAPFFTADQYGLRLQASLERALGRHVVLDKVRFNLFKGPGFSVGKVIIYEDPAIGIEWPLPKDDLIPSERDPRAALLADVADELPFVFR